MPNNDGYIKVTSNAEVFDQAISGNWSYNPESIIQIMVVPVSVMAQDF